MCICMCVCIFVCICSCICIVYMHTCMYTFFGKYNLITYAYTYIGRPCIAKVHMYI